MQQPFPYLQSVYFALTMVIENFSVFFPLSCIWALVLLCLHYVVLPLIGLIASPFLTGLIAKLLLAALLVLFMYQLIKISCALYLRNPLSLTVLYDTPRRMAQYFYAQFFYLTGTFLGLLLGIAPGLFIASQFYFTGVSLITSETTSFHEDVQKASIISEGCQWQLLFAYLVKSCLFIALFRQFPQVECIMLLQLMPIISLIDIHLYFTLTATV